MRNPPPPTDDRPVDSLNVTFALRITVDRAVVVRAAVDLATA
jgi:hypothetical protein